jgi:hypothetical protein
MNRKQKITYVSEKNRIGLKDCTAMLIAFVQLVWPYVAISIAAYLILFWILTKFWL